MADPATTEEEMILGLLADAQGQCVSGEIVSGKLGLRPSDVFHLVGRLRGRGYRIDTISGAGYRLVSVPDRLSPLEIEPFLTTHDLGRGIHFEEAMGSTSSRAMELAREGAFHGELVVTEHQTEGRGRRGRSWVSPPTKGLAFSVVLRPAVPPQRAPELTFVAAIAVARTLRDAFNLPADIKWPNDVEISGRKICGILTELDAEIDQVRAVVLGVGLNVNLDPEDFPEELRAHSTSIKIELGDEVHRALLLAALLARLEADYDLWVEEGFEPIRQTWKLFSSTIGRDVRIIPGEGRQGFDGVAEDIDEGGALQVRGSDGLARKVVAGDVKHLKQGSPGP